MKLSDDRKHAINKRITETCNKNSKSSSVGITTEIQSVVAATIKGFMNAHRSHNKYDSISGSPNINVINEGSNRQASATANRPE